MNSEGDLIIPVPCGLPYDDSGMLVEARGKPFRSPVDAVYSLMASVHELRHMTKATLVTLPYAKVTKEQKFAVRRSFSKGTNNYQNLYGYEYHKTRQNEHTSGIHISFTNPAFSTAKDGTRMEYNAMFDFPQLFRKLDMEFKDEIKASKRNPGFYEIKSDGRVEYRSLPSNVSLGKIIDVLNKIVGE